MRTRRWLFTPLLLAIVLGMTAKAEETTIEVGYMPILPVAQLFVLEDAGWADEAGLDLELTRFGSGPAMVQAMASGELDVMYFGIGPAMVARSRGMPIKVLASSIREQIGLVARGELASRFEASKGDAAEAIARFTRETGGPPKIATFPQGSVPDTVLRYWLIEALGIGTDAVEIVPMGADRVQQALLAGAVDGASILEPILTTVQSRLDDASVVARAPAMLPGQPGAVLAARETVLDRHPQAIQRLVALHVRATELLENDPVAAAPHVRAFVGKRLIPLETVEAALRSPASNYAADPQGIRQGTRRMHDFQIDQGTLTREVDLDALFDTRFHEQVNDKQ